MVWHYLAGGKKEEMQIRSREREKEKEWEKKEGWVEWEGEIRISKYLTYLYFRLDKMIDGKVKQVKNRKKRKQEPNQ